MSQYQAHLLTLIYIHTFFVGFTQNLELSLETIYVKALAGSRVEIPCGCDLPGEGNHVTWVKGQSGPVIVSRKGRRGKVKVGEDWKDAQITVNRSTLTIPALQFPRDHGEFVCSASHDTNVVVTVLAPVKTVVISGTSSHEGKPTLDVAHGQPAKVTCTALANPKALFRWKLETGTLPTAVPDNKTDSHSMSVRFSVTGDMDGKTVECMAKNDLAEWVSTKAYLRVLRRPTNPSITVTPNRVTFVEGENVSLSCLAEGTPAPMYRWILLGAGGSANRKVSSSAFYTLPSIQAAHSGTYKCIAYNSQGQITARTHIDVTPPPTVNVTYDERSKTLSCASRGGPFPVDFEDWQQTLDGQVIATHPGRIQGQTTVLHLSGLTYEDTGYYVCRAAHGSSGVQTGGVYIQPKVKPVFQRNQPSEISASHNQPLDISVLYYAHPRPSIVRWDKSRVDGIGGRASERTYRQRQQSANVTLTFHGTLATLPGTAAIFSIRKLKKADAGSYTLTLGNSRGLSVFRFSVSVIHREQNPTGRSEESSIRNLMTYVLAGLGAVVLLIIVVVLLCVCGVIPFPGRKSKSRAGYSPTAEKDKDKQDAWMDITKAPTNGNIDTFHGVAATDLMLKEDVNENHQL